MDSFGPGKRGNEDGLWDWNLETRRIHFSPRWISMLGCEQHEVGNTPEEWFRRIHPEDLKRVQSEIEVHLAGTSPEFTSQHRMLHKDGTYRWMSCHGVVSRNEHGQPNHLAGSHSDVTAEKVADALTGLPNRVLLLDRLARSIELAKRRNDFLFAVLLLDIDRFSSLVEGMGSRAGDELLVAAARRLETSLRAGDTVARLGRDHVVARLGGDEFTILLDGLNDVGEAKSIAERLLREISAPFDVGGRQTFLSASIGIAMSVTGYIRPEDALRDADVALHRAKSLGKARCEVFDSEALNSAQVRLQLETDLQEALARQEFAVVYQPIVALESNEIAGFEALLRWNHPSRGAIPPQEFIPIAQRTGLIVPLGRWVLQEACRQLKAWQAQQGVPGGLWISVNFSSLQFKQPALVKQIGEILHDAELEPRCLVLELTESVVMENPEAVSNLLMQLRVLGVKIGLDDFGTGYSSLSYLRQFPVDFLKIDHSFVRRMETSKDLAEITRTIGSLSHQLGLRVIAEGIENEEQLSLVRSLNCEYGQGYLFSRPIDGEKAETLLTTGLHQQRQLRSGSGIAQARTAAPKRVSWDLERTDASGTRVKWPLTAQLQSMLGQLVGPALAVCAASILLLAAVAIVKISGRMSPAPGGPPTEKYGDPVLTSGAPNAEKTSGAPTSADSREKAGGDRNRRAVQAAPHSSAPGQNERTAPPVGQAPAAKGTSRNPAVPAALVKKPASPAAEFPVTSFAVVHDHVLGSCTGTLKISPDSLSYVTDRRKDAFDLKCGEFSYSASDDQLTIKSATRTFRFKPGAAKDHGSARVEIQNMLQSISTACTAKR
jgi:diguanylate cyclase (GGDEF)-like protein/PAS domain S-box-containing protein